mmetsp:Transcript_34556/g.114444  ORF Transcript_34556/g.114444 Transcript_34556/m.114444 type:complete len:367 (-) Transcript_34556:41-1141(-)
MVPRPQRLYAHRAAVRLIHRHLELALVDDVEELRRTPLLVDHRPLAEAAALREGDRHVLKHLEQPRPLPRLGALAHRSGESGRVVHARNLVEDLSVDRQHLEWRRRKHRRRPHAPALQQAGLAEEVARAERRNQPLLAVRARDPHLAGAARDYEEGVHRVPLLEHVRPLRKGAREGASQRLAVALVRDASRAAAAAAARLEQQLRLGEQVDARAPGAGPLDAEGPLHLGHAWPDHACRQDRQRRRSPPRVCEEAARAGELVEIVAGASAAPDRRLNPRLGEQHPPQAGVVTLPRLDERHGERLGNALLQPPAGSSNRSRVDEGASDGRSASPRSDLPPTGREARGRRRQVGRRAEQAAEGDHLPEK